MHIFYTNKVPQVVLQFLWTCTHLGGEEPTCTWGRHGWPCRCGHPSRCGRTCLMLRLRSESLPSPHAQLGWTSLIKETSVWLNGWSCDHLDQWVHLSGRSTATTVIPRPSWASLSEGGSSHDLEVGRPHLEVRPHLPTTVPTKTDWSYRPSTASGARIRSIQVKRRWIIGSVAPPHQAAPTKMGPHAQPTSLTYKRASHPLDWTHIAGTSHFHSVHLE
jgi:hypothetical protein